MDIEESQAVLLHSRHTDLRSLIPDILESIVSLLHCCQADLRSLLPDILESQAVLPHSRHTDLRSLIPDIPESKAVLPHSRHHLLIVLAMERVVGIGDRGPGVTHAVLLTHHVSSGIPEIRGVSSRNIYVIVGKSDTPSLPKLSRLGSDDSVLTISLHAVFVLAFLIDMFDKVICRCVDSIVRF